MLKNPVKRSGQFRPIPKELRRQADRLRCEVCSADYGNIEITEAGLHVVKQHLHHLLPRRWLQEHGIYEHHCLLSVCDVCHGKATVCEDRLYQGDVLGFLQGMKKAGFPVTNIVTFAVTNGLGEFGTFKL